MTAFVLPSPSGALTGPDGFVRCSHRGPELTPVGLKVAMSIKSRNFGVVPMVPPSEAARFIASSRCTGRLDTRKMMPSGAQRGTLRLGSGSLLKMWG